MLTPIIEFESEAELQNCINYWKSILFLDDWLILGKLVTPPLYDEDDKELMGKNTFNIESHSSRIEIIRPTENEKNRICKFCGELVVVHELLHLKYNWCSPPQTHEGIYYDVSEHALIEQMAKSLIMTKYRLTFDWFKNF